MLSDIGSCSTGYYMYVLTAAFGIPSSSAARWIPPPVYILASAYMYTPKLSRKFFHLFCKRYP